LHAQSGARPEVFRAASPGGGTGLAAGQGGGGANSAATTRAADALRVDGAGVVEIQE